MAAAAVDLSSRAMLSQPPDAAFVWTVAIVLLWLACGPIAVALRRATNAGEAAETRAIWLLRALSAAVIAALLPRAVSTTVHDTLAALAVPAVCTIVGAVAGRTLALWLGSRRRARILAMSLFLGIGCLGTVSATLGIYDALLLFCVTSAGSWIGAVKIDKRGLAATLRAAAYACFFSGLLLETAVRTILPTPQRPPHAPTHGLFYAGVLDRRCAALFPDTYAGSSMDLFAQRSAGPPRRQHVLHVGDSMTEGVGAGLDNAFAAVLARRQPDVAHTNAGFGGTGTDVHAIVIREWIDRLAAAGKPVDLVLLHYFGNDDDELGLTYSCCGSEPLMIWDGVRSTRRCPNYEGPSAQAEIIYGAPPPHLLRATGWISVASTQLVLQIWGLETQSSPTDSRMAGQRVSALIMEINDFLTSRGIDFILVDIGLVPDDPRYAAIAHGESPAIAGARRAGIATYAANEAVRRGRDLEGVDALRAADGTHYSAAGHVALADWLAPIIDERLARRRVETGL